MIKKISIIVVITVFVVGAVGFFGFADSVEAETYVGYSEADDRGYTEARIILEAGELVDVDLTEYNDLARPKPEDYPLDEYHEAMRVLPERFVEANSTDIDTYSGATGTSNSAIEAVSMALDKAEGISQFDGTYMGKSDISERGNYGIAWVTVKNGEITEVNLEEVAEGEYKDEDYDYDDYHTAREEMPSRFEEANDYDVDTYTGATGSSERWIQAVRRALAKSLK